MTKSDPNIEQLRAEMQSIRRELNGDVERIVRTAQVMTDWRHYVRKFPWFAIGAAAAVGFLIVPSKPRDLKQGDAETPEKSASTSKPAAPIEQTPKATASLGSSLFRMALGIALKVGMAAIERQIKASANRARSQTTPGSSPDSSPSSSGAGNEPPGDKHD